MTLKDVDIELNEDQRTRGFLSDIGGSVASDEMMNEIMAQTIRGFGLMDQDEIQRDIAFQQSSHNQDRRNSLQQTE